MKMVKSLLLGSAAGLVAVSGAAAADLPVKAKPVQYVKICSLYGSGYFYIPGTDTCLKIGGALRVQYEWGAGNGGTINGFGNTYGRNTAVETSPTALRNRIYFSLDARQQTEYGTLRTYFRFGQEYDTPPDAAGGVVFFDRGFIQFAGFTFGRTVSYWDPFGTGDLNFHTSRVSADSAAAGNSLVAYTAQFGGGVSATVALEDPNQRGRIVNDFTAAGAAGYTLGATGGTDSAFTAGATGFRIPDVVANIRIDQAWGSAQLSGALRDVTAVAPAGPGTVMADEIGWAIGGGVLINLPGWGARGNAIGQSNVDTFRIAVNFCEGMNGYCGQSNGSNGLRSGTLGAPSQTIAVGISPDAVFQPAAAGGPGTLNLTSAWNVFAAFQHIWTPTLRTSLYGGVTAYEFNAAAQALICPGGPGGAGAAFGGVLTARGAGFVCDADFRVWQIGSRTQWNPVAQLDLGIDVVYTALDSESSGPATMAAAGTVPAGAVTVEDKGQLAIMARAQRNFWP